MSFIASYCVHLQESAHRGLPLFVLHFVSVLWWRNMRSCHAWIACLIPTLDGLLVATRAQRVVTLLIAILANMAVATLIIRRATFDGQTVVAGVSAAVSTPVFFILPVGGMVCTH